MTLGCRSARSMLVEPVLTVLVELSYDRTVPVWQSTPIRLLPPPEQVLAALPKLRDALAKVRISSPETIRTRSKNATVDQLENC